MTDSYNAFFGAAFNGNLKMFSRNIGPSKQGLVAINKHHSVELSQEEPMDDGVLVRTLYCNGVKTMSRVDGNGNLEVLVASTPDGTYWYTTNKNGWFPLD